MEKHVLEELIETNHSQKQMADNLGLSKSSVKYWLKKYGLKTKYRLYNKNKNLLLEEKTCPRCSEIKPLTDFYKRSNRDDVGGYCKKCSNDYHTNRVKEVKIKMIEHMGGECTRCSLKLIDTHYAVFDFHHKDPKEKDEVFKGLKMKKWETIEKELKKCVLVCSNCHRLIHAEMGGW